MPRNSTVPLGPLSHPQWATKIPTLPWAQAFVHRNLSTKFPRTKKWKTLFSLLGQWWRDLEMTIGQPQNKTNSNTLFKEGIINYWLYYFVVYIMTLPKLIRWNEQVKNSYRQEAEQLALRRSAAEELNQGLIETDSATTSSPGSFISPPQRERGMKRWKTIGTRLIQLVVSAGIRMTRFQVQRCLLKRFIRSVRLYTSCERVFWLPLFYGWMSLSNGWFYGFGK